MMTELQGSAICSEVFLPKHFLCFGQLFRAFSVILRFPLFLLLIVAIVLLLLCEIRKSHIFLRFLAKTLVTFLVILVPAPVRKGMK